MEVDTQTFSVKPRLITKYSPRAWIILMVARSNIITICLCRYRNLCICTVYIIFILKKSLVVVQVLIL